MLLQEKFKAIEKLIDKKDEQIENYAYTDPRRI